MTFFNWFNADGAGAPQVSSYFWIYVVFTVFATIATLLCWWYFVVYRRNKTKKGKADEDDDISLV
jgi:hypothetical protein